MNRGFMFVVITFLILPLNAQKNRMNRMTIEEYVQAYKDFAVTEMNRSGVPASITLAQGIVESDCGNSTLARKANNHFGIKCHDNWQKGKIYQDDDEPNECFRKYDSVLESFQDHSNFLRSTSRYSSLFKLKPDDYKGWSKGLKKAGYATNPAYADQLIHIIEEHHLHQYDLAMIPKKKEPVFEKKKEKQPVTTENEFTVDIAPRRVYRRNRVDYIVAKEGDTYNKIVSDMNLMPWELAMFNDMSKDAPINPGDVLYLSPKRNRAERGFDIHVVENGETMHTIAQKYAIKLKKLYKYNRMTDGTEPLDGERIFLRKTRKANDQVKAR